MKSNIDAQKQQIERFALTEVEHAALQGLGKSKVHLETCICTSMEVIEMDSNL